jgi:hypothetical protein
MRATEIASLLTVLSATSGLAIECPVDHAIYTQKTKGWVLKISPVGEDGAANQFVALRLEAPGGITPWEGGIYQPNGFGQVMASVDQGCPADIAEAEDADADDQAAIDAAAEDCRGYHGSIYALVGNGIEPFPVDYENRSAPAPQQVLLPDFAAGVWYSPIRELAFTEMGGPEDIFTLAACAK